MSYAGSSRPSLKDMWVGIFYTDYMDHMHTHNIALLRPGDEQGYDQIFFIY